MGEGVAIIGGGPAGLMAAEVVAEAGVPVTVFDRMPSVGRKLLMAGRGGLNLTHSEPLPAFLGRYGAAAPFLAPLIEAFPPGALRAWCDGLGQASFVGSSGRVFPAALKSSPLLRAWAGRLDRLGVRFAMRHRWTGWSPDGSLGFDTPDGPVRHAAAATVLALGGASWPRLGSDGGWTGLLEARGVRITPWQAANCGVLVAWSDVFRARFEGQPLKRVILRAGGATASGDAVVTAAGLEGGPVYALTPALREERTLSIDLRPDLTAEALALRLSTPRRAQSLSTFLRKHAGLAPPAIGLLWEAGRPPADPAALAARIKAVALPVAGPAPIARAISSAGGIALDQLDAQLMLTRLPGVFAAGEMLDWEAPTGGYLLQAGFATGVAAARGVLAWLG